MKFTDYIQGKRRGKEANALEREAMNDAFLQDAMDGYDTVKDNPMSAIKALEKRVSAAYSPAPKRNIKRILFRAGAAMLVLLIGTQVLRWFHTNQTITLPEKNAVTVLPSVKQDSVFTEKKKPVRKEIFIADNAPKKIAPKKTRTENQIVNTEEITNNTFDETISAFKSEESMDKKQVESSISALKPESLRIDSIPSSPKLLSNYLTSVNENKLTGALAGRAAGITVTQKKENDIIIRGTSSLTKSLPEKRVRGRLIDETGEALIGAQVTLKNKKQVGTITDLNGEFELNIPPNLADSVLVASYVGMERKEFLAKENTGDIKLPADSKALNEVVVVGYGATKKSRMTGSTTKAHVPTFGKKEFIQYFKSNYDKDICNGHALYIQTKFRINEQGRPEDIEIIETSCAELEEELKDWLSASPMWTERNTKVILTIKIKRK